MKKWFTWQLKNQVKNANWPDTADPITNLATELEWFSKLVIDGYNNKKVECYFDNVFFRPDWIAKASDSTNGAVTPDELYNWMHDPEYDTLMSRQGLEYITKFNDDVESQIKKILADKLNLDEDSINFRVHVQLPGEFFALHFDRNKYGQFDTNKSLDDYETHSKIFLIFLTDRCIGQSFHLGPAQLDWKAGDVFTWEQENMPHGSSNCGLESRFSIVLTGYTDTS